MALTDAGRALLPHARRVLAAAGVAEASVSDVAALRVGRVAVGTGKALPIDIVACLVRFCAEFPGIDVSLRGGGSMELLAAVGDGRLDFAPLGLVGTLPQHLDETVQIVELLEEPMVLACVKTHRLVADKTVHLRDTVGERFADFGREWAIRIANDRAFADLGSPRRVAYEMSDVDDLLEVVRQGLAVAVVPESVRGRARDLGFVGLRPPTPAWSVGVAVARGCPPSPAAAALFEAMLPGTPWPS